MKINNDLTSVNHMTLFLLKTKDYPFLDIWYEAQQNINDESDPTKFNDSSLGEIIMHASNVGNIVRIAYYKFVHQSGVDVRYLADACVQALFLTGTLLVQFEDHKNDPQVKAWLKKTRYPKWTWFGLVGGSTQDIQTMGKEFSEWMDSTKAIEYPIEAKQLALF